MGLFTWRPEYEIGHELIDQQHRHLTDLINQLDDAVAVNLDHNTSRQLLDELVDYTHYHFATEEGLMASLPGGRSAHADHIAAHRQFSQQIRHAADTPLDRQQAPELLQFLVSWLIEHILHQDRLLVQQLQPNTVSPAAAGQLPASTQQLLDALKASEQRFRMLADCTPALLWISDANGARNFFNSSWLAFTRTQPAELQQEAWQRLLHPDDLPVYLNAYSHALHSRQSYETEFRLRHHSDEYRCMHEKAAPRWLPDGQFAGFSGACQDISSLKQAQRLQQSLNQELQARVDAKTAALEREKQEQHQLIQQLQETQQQLIQSEKMAAIGHLAAGVAHEINNPIGYIRSNITTLGNYLEQLTTLLGLYRQAQAGLANHPLLPAITALVKRTEPDFIIEDTAALLAETQEGLERVKQIVQDLKDFSRVESSDWQEADLCQCLDTTVNLARNEVKYKAEIVRDYSPLPPITCLPNQLSQVFMNLIVNAAQALERQGQITLRTYRQEDWACVEIEDNGCGMPAEIQSKIFDPFFTTKPVGQGTGLGLSISYSIIEKHHGQMRVHSSPGQGSRFIIQLPLTQPTTPQ